MKNVLLAIAAVIFLNSCEAQSTTEPDTSVVAQDPKCLFRSQWSIDREFSNPYPANYWFQVPNLGFSSATEGYLFVGFQKGQYKNNTVNLYVEMFFTYTINQNKLVFKITNIKTYRGGVTLLAEETGEEAIKSAKDIMNILHLGDGVKFACKNRTLKFEADEPVTKVPLKVYNWSQSN